VVVEYWVVAVVLFVRQQYQGVYLIRLYQAIHHGIWGSNQFQLSIVQSSKVFRRN
jgi:hypothetical protein